jgi:hypothetical protein
MLNNLLVAITIAAGVIALAGVPLRAWQFHTGRFRSRIPRHALARATFSLFAVLFLVPNLIAWAYTLYIVYTDLTCVGACAPPGVRTAVAVGMLGCAYALLEGFLFTACHHPARAIGPWAGLSGKGRRG